MRTLLVAVVLVAFPSFAKIISRPVSYQAGATKLEGVLIFDDATKTPRPGVVLVPNWLGLNAPNLKQAEEVAGDKYVVFVADMFGKGKSPKDMAEAGKVTTALKADRKLMRERVSKALETLLAQAKTAPLDVTKVGAMGFCFGGTTALELARGGAKLNAVVAIHAGLDSPTPDDAKQIKGKVLALSGADDPYSPPEQRAAFETEMRNAKVDWQLVAFGNTVHSYTDVDANMAGQAQYNPTSAKRAYKMMNDFFAEAFGG